MLAFFTLRDQLVAQQKYLFRVEVVAKSRVWGVFERQILALLLFFHQTHNLSRNKICSCYVTRRDFCISYFTALTEYNLQPTISKQTCT